MKFSVWAPLATASVELVCADERSPMLADAAGNWHIECTPKGIAHGYRYSLDGGPPQLEVALDRDSGQNGDLAHLTIAPGSGASKGLAPYRLLVTLDGIQNVWFGVVDLKTAD